MLAPKQAAPSARPRTRTRPLPTRPCASCGAANAPRVAHGGVLIAAVDHSTGVKPRRSFAWGLEKQNPIKPQNHDRRHCSHTRDFFLSWLRFCLSPVVVRFSEPCRRGRVLLARSQPLLHSLLPLRLFVSFCPGGCGEQRPGPIFSPSQKHMENKLSHISV